MSRYLSALKVCVTQIHDNSKMKLLQDLPYLPLRKICIKLTFDEKIKFYQACSTNSTLSEVMRIICYQKRRKHCPFCILYVGTSYETKVPHRDVHDFHNQILNHYDNGDSNWEFVPARLTYKCKQSDNKSPIGFFMQPFTWVEDVDDLLENTVRQEQADRVSLLNHI